MFVGGDILEVTYTHPVVGSGSFFPKAGEDFTFDPGGVRSEDNEDGIAGNGEMIDTMTRKRWSMEGPIANDMNDFNDLDVLKKLAAHPVAANWTVSIINGTVWGGKGKPVGEIKASVKNSSIPIKISGSGDMRKIAG